AALARGAHLPAVADVSTCRILRKHRIETAIPVRGHIRWDCLEQGQAPPIGGSMVNTAVVGTSVTVLFAGDSEPQTYRLVDEHETHYQNAVSVGSPLGLAVL